MYKNTCRSKANIFSTTHLLVGQPNLCILLFLRSSVRQHHGL